MNAGMVESVDTPDLKSCGPQARAGSTPAPGTIKIAPEFQGLFLLYCIDSHTSSKTIYMQ